MTLLILAAAFAGCVPAHENALKVHGDDRGPETRGAATFKPCCHVTPLFHAVQYVGTDEIYRPKLHYLPSSMHLPRPGVEGAQKWREFMFIANTGRADLTRQDVRITGSDSAKFRLISSHAPTLILPPGEFEDFEVEYLPRRCRTLFNPLAVDEATLRIVSDAGVVEVTLTGSRRDCTRRIQNTEESRK